MAFYLGIDGGGSKTKLLLGDEQRLLAEATTSGSNILRSGKDAVRSALHAAIDEICQRGGTRASDIRRVVAGIAGSSNEAVRVLLEAALREKIQGGVEVLGDMEIAHHAALEGSPGVLVNAGTGSIAYGKNANGQAARAGGWGFAISDEGSGHWIGRNAVATAMRSFDTQQDEDFLHHMMSAVGAKTPEELAKFANASANPDFVRLFPEVVTLAQLGDTIAAGILQRAGEELSRLADAVLERIFRGARGVRVAAAGGVFRGSDAVFQSFRKQIGARHPSAIVFLSVADPAMGALMLARRAR
jgi:N-acetylglucosamine kinase-like BadF-type ATPase